SITSAGTSRINGSCACSRNYRSHHAPRDDVPARKNIARPEVITRSVMTTVGLLIDQFLAARDQAELRHQDAVPQDQASHRPQEQPDQAERDPLAEFAAREVASQV